MENHYMRLPQRTIHQPGNSDGAREAAPAQKPGIFAADSLQLYLAEIRKYPLLTRGEERTLAISYQENADLEAAHRLVTSNLRLVVKIAMGFRRQSKQSLLDLIQEGNVGLVKAIEKFDPHRGYKFSYYASFWIKAYIIKCIMDNYKLVKLGTTQAQRKLFFNLRKEKQKLRAQGIKVSSRLLSSRLNVKESVVIDMDQRLNSHDLSLDTPLKEDHGSTLKNLLPSNTRPVDEQVAQQEWLRILRGELACFRGQLHGKEAVIFDKRLVAEDRMTLQRIGDEYGVSRERIRQIESRLKDKLKAHLEREMEEPALPGESPDSQSQQPFT